MTFLLPIFYQKVVPKYTIINIPSFFINNPSQRTKIAEQRTIKICVHLDVQCSAVGGLVGHVVMPVTNAFLVLLKVISYIIKASVQCHLHNIRMLRYTLKGYGKYMQFYLFFGWNQFHPEHHKYADILIIAPRVAVRHKCLSKYFELTFCV